MLHLSLGQQHYPFPTSFCHAKSPVNFLSESELLSIGPFHSWSMYFLRGIMCLVPNLWATDFGTVLMLIEFAAGSF